MTVRSILKWTLPAVLACLLIYPLIGRPGSGSPASAAGSDPAAADEQLNRSLQAYQAGKYREAVLDARAALQARPNFAAAYNNLAVSYLQLKMYDDAISSARAAIRLQPDFELAKNNLAWIQQEIAKAKGTPPVPPASSGPETADSYLNLSLQEYQAGRYQESIDAARRALRLDPAMAAAYNNIAASYSSMRMWDPAVENAETAIRLQPDFQLARNNLAWALKGKASMGSGR
jgi:tetratricopeptide (TPR) repeat protein